MKIYVGRNHKGTYKASLDKEKLAKFDNVFETELPIIHNNKVYIIKTYYGYDYKYGFGEWDSTVDELVDVVTVVTTAFHSVTSAKKSKTWKGKENLAKENPEKFHVTPFSIVSDDCGSPFICGDTMLGMFNMEIIAVRLIYIL